MAKTTKRNIIGFEAPDEDVDRAEALIDFVGKRIRKPSPTLSDVYRVALDSGLSQLAKEQAKAAKEAAKANA